MSDRVSFLLKYGRAEDIHKIVSGYRQHGIDNAGWAISTAMKNPACPREIIDHAATSKFEYLRNDALRHPNLSPEVHQKALNSPDAGTRLSAWHNPMTTIEHLEHASKHDPSTYGPSNAKHILQARLEGKKAFNW